MSKIQSIQIQNLKAIGELAIDFKGCTAIITGGNNTGKTTFLRSIPDRVRKATTVNVKDGATQGKGEMTLTDGTRFLWDFNSEGKDALTVITKDGIKLRNPVKDITSRYFTPQFDIDVFLQSTPKDQSKQLQKALGIDFTELDAKIKTAYDNRTACNKDVERENIKLANMGIPEQVQPVDLTDLQSRKTAERNRLNTLYLANVEANKTARNEWEKAKLEVISSVELFNESLEKPNKRFEAINNAANTLIIEGYGWETLPKWIEEQRALLSPFKNAYTIISDTLPEPTYIPERPDSTALDAIDAQIANTASINLKAQQYTDYVNQKDAATKAQAAADKADADYKKLEAERKQVIADAKFPTGIEITTDGLIQVDGFALSKSVLSSSKLYTAALRIGAMNLGEVKTLYFDASYLDKNSLTEIEQWANENDLQLLIERPDFNAGEITYQLIETTLPTETKTTLF
jgi:hypothetical protein